MFDSPSKKPFGKPSGNFRLSVFSSPQFLELSGEEPYELEFDIGKNFCGRLFGVKKADRLTRGTYQVYGGMSFSDEVEAGQIASSRFQKDLAVGLEPVVRKFSRIELGLDPTLTDMRGLTWLNFNSPDIKSSLTPRYTSVISLSNWSSAVSKSRLADSKRGLNNGLSFSSIEPSAFALVYRQFHLRQGLSDESLEPAMKIIHGNFDGVDTRLYQVHQDGSTAACVLFMIDHSTAHMMFLARAPELDVGGASSLLLTESLKHLSKVDGMSFVDLVGINSPQRGAFKESFGGLLTLYFNWSAQRLYE